MSTNLKNIDSEGFVEITDSQKKEYTERIVALLKKSVDAGTQEITIISSEPIYFKTKGILEPINELQPWDDDTFNYFLEHMAYETLKTTRRAGKNEINTRFFDKLIEENNFSKDFAVSLKGKTLRIHAVSIYNGAGVQNKYKYCFTIRVVMNDIPDYDDLHLPAMFKQATNLTSGLILISGHTGSGKTTTIASLVKEINKNPAMRRSILTIEDPIEFVHKSSQAIILQRALGINTSDYTEATKDALRENVDTVIIGELREAEAMDNAIRLAEMGKLVFATVHCNSPADAVDRIVDEFSGDLQVSVRNRLAEVVVGILHQNLEVLKNKEGEEVQIPSASGFLVEKANQKSVLRSSFTRKGIAECIAKESWTVPYSKAYEELVKNGVIEDTQQNRKILVPN